MAIHHANIQGEQASEILIQCLQNLNELRECVSSAVAIGTGKRAQESSSFREFITKYNALVAELRNIVGEVTGEGRLSTDRGGYHINPCGVNFR